MLSGFSNIQGLQKFVIIDPSIDGNGHWKNMSQVKELGVFSQEERELERP